MPAFIIVPYSSLGAVARALSALSSPSSKSHTPAAVDACAMVHGATKYLTAARFGRSVRVAIKLMRNEDQWQREIDVTEKCDSGELLGTRNESVLPAQFATLPFLHQHPR